MVHKNYKWNISLEDGKKKCLQVVKKILREQKNETMETNELILLINNRSRHLHIMNHQKKKSLMNFINSTCGGFIQFVDLYDCLGIIQDGTHVKVKLIDNNTTDFNGWIHVEHPQ
jgi:hypothetical protein